MAYLWSFLRSIFPKSEAAQNGIADSGSRRPLSLAEIMAAAAFADIDAAPVEWLHRPGLINRNEETDRTW